MGVRRYVLLALSLTSGLAGLSVGIIRPVLIGIAETYTISVALAGQLMTGAALAGMAGNLVFAPLVDRFDRRATIIGALVLMTVGSLGCAVAPTFIALAISYALAGLSGITLLAVIVASAGDLYDGEQRGRALGWILAGNVGVGMVVLPALSALADPFGWPVVFYGFAGLAALAIVLARVLLPADMRSRSCERLGYLATLGKIAGNRKAAALLFAIATYHASIYGFSTYAGAVAGQRLGATTGQTGLVLSARALGISLAGALMGRFLRATDWRMAAAAALSSAVLGLLAYGAAASLWSYGALILLHGAAVGVADIGIVGLLLESEPRRRGLVTVLRGVMEGVGGMLGPASGGVVIAASGYAAAGWLFALIVMLTVAAVAASARLHLLGDEPESAP
jgi:predicted MFS family arabinose efflux permease